MANSNPFVPPSAVDVDLSAVAWGANRTMSDFETGMWRMEEAQPQLRSPIVAVEVLDRAPGLGSTSRRSRVGIARGSAYSYASSGTGNAAGQSGVVRRSRVRHRLPPTTRPLTCTGGLRSRTAHVSSPCDGTFRQGSTAVERAAHRRSRRRSRRVRGQDSPLHHRRHGRHPDDDAPAQQTPGPHSEQARPHTACS